MKNTRRTLSFLFTLGVLFTTGAAFAQAPNIPKIPPSDTALKNAEAAQKASEKAEAAKKAAEKAVAASASAEKAAAAQKTAEKASVASAAAEKADAAKRAADKAAAASAAVEKAKAAQELSSKAQKAAEKAEAASVAADKAAAAQKAADKAAGAQKNAAQAVAAQKAATKAEAAQKASDKAAAASRPAEKSQSVTAATEKAAVRQAAVEKLTTINSPTAQAEAARKATQNAAKVSATATSAPDVTRIRLLNQPAPETKGGDDQKTPDFTVTGQPRNPIADRKAREEAARSVRVPEPAPAAAAPTAADEIRLTKDAVRDGLADLEVAPDVASKLADDFVDPEKAPSTRVRVEEIANTSLDLQTVSVPEETRRKIIDEVSRSADPSATANEKVGEAATEEVFGKDVAVLVPADKRGKFREVFQNLADLRSGLETIGGSPDDPEVVEAVKEGAVRGVTTREETRVIFEGAGQKVLDRQGFSPAKEGEGFNARLGRIAEEQKAELAAMKAAKAAAAAAAAEKLTKGKVSVGAAITQGAAGSTAIGRSVSARVEVAIGGGRGTTSGAGTATQGTGTDASKATGIGGQNRSELLASRLPSDTGGAFTAGKSATGRVDQAAPGTAPAPAVSSVPTAPGALDAGLGANGSQAAAAAAPGSPSETAVGPGAPTANSSTVDSPAGEVVIGGGEGSSFGGHFQSGDGNTGGNLTFNPDGTFSGTVTTVTRDASGNITNSSDTSVVGTWGLDADGNVVVTSATAAPSTSSDNNQSTPPAGNQQANGGSGGNGSETSTSTGTSSDDNDDDDDDDSDDDGDTPPPPPAVETKAEETPAEESSEESKAADSTPNPMDHGGVNPMALAEQTGGRLGGTEARRQQRALQLAVNGGGAGGPNPDGGSTTPTLLTPEEQANAARLIGVKTGGSVTNPNPIKTGGMAVTERDLKELHLRGNGGAAGPTDTTPSAPPQDPHSPIGGLAPGPAPTGGNRINGVQAPAVQVDRIDVSGQLQENVK